jgi:hypothetical protein
MSWWSKNKKFVILTITGLLLLLVGVLGIAQMIFPRLTVGASGCVCVIDIREPLIHITKAHCGHQS